MYVFFLIVGTLTTIYLNYFNGEADALWFKFKGIYCEVDFLCEPLGYGSYSKNLRGFISCLIK